MFARSNTSPQRLRLSRRSSKAFTHLLKSADQGPPPLGEVAAQRPEGASALTVDAANTASGGAAPSVGFADSSPRGGASWQSGFCESRGSSPRKRAALKGVRLGMTRVGVILLALMACGTTAAAAAEPATAAPCDAAVYRQLDFWLGRWQVYDGDSGRLVATDRIEKRLGGCVVEQNMTFVTDMYRRPGVAYRLAGASTSRFDGQQWLQIWVDNQWGAITMAGAADKDGSMVFNTIIPSRGRDVRLVWQPQPEGAVRILQYVAPTGSGKWEKYGDLLYRPDPRSGRPPQAPGSGSTPCRRSASTKGSRCLR